MHTILLVLLGSIIIGASNSKAETNPLVGEWSTDEIMSQLGPSITTYTFSENGNVAVSTKFTLGKIPEMKASGTYEITSDKLIMKVNERTIKDSYYFDGPILVIDEGKPTKVFRLTRTK